MVMQRVRFCLTGFQQLVLGNEVHSQREIEPSISRRTQGQLAKDDKLVLKSGGT